jgi:predicted DNA-binding transcriptional regulator AlpA
MPRITNKTVKRAVRPAVRYEEPVAEPEPVLEPEPQAVPTVLPALLLSSELAVLLHVNRSTVYHWRRAGIIPEPIRVLPRLGAVWLLSEIREWLAAKIG